MKAIDHWKGVGGKDIDSKKEIGRKEIGKDSTALSTIYEKTD